MKIRYVFQMIGSLVTINLRRLSGNHISCPLITLVSPKATLLSYTKLGHISIGYRSAIRANTEVNADGGDIVIGNKCFINKNCMIISHKRIIIEDEVTIGPNVCIYDHDHDGNAGYISQEVTIGHNSWIGAGCIILKGVSIGSNCIIGAGTLITKNIPDNSILYQKRNDYCEKRVLQ